MLKRDASLDTGLPSGTAESITSILAVSFGDAGVLSREKWRFFISPEDERDMLLVRLIRLTKFLHSLLSTMDS